LKKGNKKVLAPGPAKLRISKPNQRNMGLSGQTGVVVGEEEGKFNSKTPERTNKVNNEWEEFGR